MANRGRGVPTARVNWKSSAEEYVTRWIRESRYCEWASVGLFHERHAYDARAEVDAQGRPAESFVWCRGAPETVSPERIEEFLDG